MFTRTPSDAGAIADYGSRPIMRTLSNVGRTIKLSDALSWEKCDRIVESRVGNEPPRVSRDPRIEILVSVTITKTPPYFISGTSWMWGFRVFCLGCVSSRGCDFVARVCRMLLWVVVLIFHFFILEKDILYMKSNYWDEIVCRSVTIWMLNIFTELDISMPPRVNFHVK